MNFYWKYFHTSGFPEFDVEMAILAPDWTNRFYKDVGLWKSQNMWYHRKMELGPHGGWSSSGSPDWLDIQGIRLTHNCENGFTSTIRLDELWFSGGHFFNKVSDAASITAYEQRDLEVIDDKLHSDAECGQRAETLLYQLKDPPIQITVPVKGNDNVLVGDRLTMTIPSEAISAQPYDVLTVENLLNLDNWTTTATMVNSSNWRSPLQLRQQVDIRRRLRELGIDEKGIR